MGWATSSYQGGHYSRVPLSHDCIQHRGPSYNQIALGWTNSRHPVMVCWWRGGRRHLWSNPHTILRTSGPGATAGLLPGTDQEYLVCSPSERVQGRGIIQGNGDDGGHQELLPWRFYWPQRGWGQMYVWEGAGVGEDSGDTVGGLLKAPIVCLRRIEEVTPTGVGICAAGHLWYTGFLWTSGTGAEVSAYSRLVPCPWRGNTREGVQQPARETCGPGPPRTNKNDPWELESVLCYHRTSCCSDQGTWGVQDGRSLSLTKWGEGRGA